MFIFYSYKDLSLGARIYYFSESIKHAFSFMDVSILMGLSHDFIYGENIVSTQPGNKEKNDFGLNIAEIGIRVGFDISKKIKILSEYSFKHHLNSTDFVTEENRNSFKIGTSYLF